MATAERVLRARPPFSKLDSSSRGRAKRVVAAICGKAGRQVWEDKSPIFRFSGVKKDEVEKWAFYLMPNLEKPVVTEYSHSSASGDAETCVKVVGALIVIPNRAQGKVFASPDLFREGDQFNKALAWLKQVLLVE